MDSPMLVFNVHDLPFEINDLLRFNPADVYVFNWWFFFMYYGYVFTQPAWDEFVMPMVPPAPHGLQQRFPSSQARAPLTSAPIPFSMFHQRMSRHRGAESYVTRPSADK